VTGHEAAEIVARADRVLGWSRERIADYLRITVSGVARFASHPDSELRRSTESRATMLAGLVAAAQLRRRKRA